MCERTFSKKAKVIRADSCWGETRPEEEELTRVVPSGWGTEHWSGAGKSPLNRGAHVRPPQNTKSFQDGWEALSRPIDGLTLESMAQSHLQDKETWFLGKSRIGENVRNGGQLRVHEHLARVFCPVWWAVRALGFQQTGQDWNCFKNDY